MKFHKPKTIKEAVNDLQRFLECDLYSRFRPAQTLPIGKNGKDETWFRDIKDVFKSEGDFIRYLEIHFKVVDKQIKRLLKMKYDIKESKSVGGEK